MSKFDTPYSTLPSEPDVRATSSSNPPPPSFESATAALLNQRQNDVVYPQYGEEQPPEFMPYEAETFLDGSGNVISHDPHLNEDGEALYRFLLSQAAEPPKFILHCKGTHTERRTRFVSSTSFSNDQHHHHHHHRHNDTRTETYTETITDFDFKIDITQHLLPVVHWTVSDNQVVNRGRMFREVEEQDGISLKKRKPTSAESKMADRWSKYQASTGLPPWIREGELGGADQRPDGPVFQSSRTVRQWADDYCDSNKLLKEFVYEKVVYGWNIGNMTQAIQQAIKSTHYSGKLYISFDTSANRVYVRPTNKLSRTLSNKWIKFLLWILLIYPFIWLFKRFHPRGGGQWKVAGGAYATKMWALLPDSHVGEDVAQYVIRKQDNDRALNGAAPAYSLDYKWQPSAAATGSSSNGSASSPTGGELDIHKLKQTPKGVAELQGIREGEWFKQWEGTIRRAVIGRLVNEEPMWQPDEVVASTAGVLLDGY